jgi:hypothetical protein
MDKDFIPYKQALELKELGFDEKCMMYYSNSLSGYTLQSTDYSYSNSHWMFNANDNKDRHLMCAAPLYQQAFRWFREKYNIFHSIYPIGISTGGKESYRWRWAAPAIIGEDIIYTDKSDLGFLTYEEAELACLKKLIEIVKKKQHD